MNICGCFLLIRLYLAIKVVPFDNVTTYGVAQDYFFSHRFVLVLGLGLSFGLGFTDFLRPRPKIFTSIGLAIFPKIDIPIETSNPIGIP